MALETATYIHQLNANNPLSTDVVAQADDHIRLIKSTIQATFPNVTAPVTVSHVQLNNPIPPGVVVMWSGNFVPTGWALCNGDNGTPDLRNRFVFCAGTETNPIGSTGGSATATLTNLNIPAHTHTIAGVSAAGGTHTHSINDPGHTHTYTVVSGFGALAGGTGVGLASTSTGGSGTGITINAAADHTHAFSGTTSSVGSGESFSILPPYYSLAFLMKL